MLFRSEPIFEILQLGQGSTTYKYIHKMMDFAEDQSLLHNNRHQNFMGMANLDAKYKGPYKDKDGCMLRDARLLHTPFDGGGRDMRCKIRKILLIPFDLGGITINLSLLQACHSQSAVQQGYVDFLKEALVTFYQTQNGHLK